MVASVGGPWEDAPMDLFERSPAVTRPSDAPLADRMRPRDLTEFVGQRHLLGPGRVLTALIPGRQVPSMIFWGPPGSGKTTLAYLIATHAGVPLLAYSAVTTGIKEVKEVIREAERSRRRGASRPILFIDEIHRFNKAQQDALLPHVERGTITLIGATTENPSFAVVAPLLSRTRVFVLEPLVESDLAIILDRTLTDPDRGLGKMELSLDPEARSLLLWTSAGDARVLLNTLELAVRIAPEDDGRRHLTLQVAMEAAQRRTLLYDKGGEEHFNQISALHKSLRDSDPDGALYWLARMLTAGEDPLYITRRLIRFASEDVGNADPMALSVALAAKEAYHFLGSPEGELVLAQCAIYLATAPKSNAVYRAYEAARADVAATPLGPVPLAIRNPSTSLLKALSYGAGYQYAPDAPDALVDQPHRPPEVEGHRYYQPSDRGFEATIRKRLTEWQARLQARREGSDRPEVP
ncbi:MAG: replication-associated recombination protein A [Candidatus Methylomirabilales bacterium]